MRETAYYGFFCVILSSNLTPFCIYASTTNKRIQCSQLVRLSDLLNNVKYSFYWFRLKLGFIVERNCVSLEPAPYITQNSSSESFIPLSATFIWTCRFNLLHSAITFHHFFTVSLWAQNLPFQKILSSTLVCFCLSDWSHGSRPSPDLFAHHFYVLVLFFCFSYS